MTAVRKRCSAGVDGVWVAWARKCSSSGCGTAGSLVSELWECLGRVEEYVVGGRLFEFRDPIGVVCARYQLRMLSARLLAAASDSDGVRSGVDLSSPGKRGLGPSRWCP